MELILIGYFPKKLEHRNDWSIAAQVMEICSVSECISAGPDGWIEHWKHNQYGLFHSVAEAVSVIPASVRDEYTIFAYSLLPIAFTAEQEIAIEIECRSIEPLPPSFKSIGFDVVSRTDSVQFECSPLSCNNGAEEISVNQYCLFNSLTEAINGARRFAAENWEPGDYYVIEVYRIYPSD